MQWPLAVAISVSCLKNFRLRFTSLRPSASRAGGERAAAIYTVSETCKLSGAEPQAYIAVVIKRISKNWPASRWDELMPWNCRPLELAGNVKLAV